VLTGLGVGLWIASIFALLPLLGVRRVPPLAALRSQFEERRSEWRDYWVWIALILLALSVVALATLQVGRLRSGALFTGGAAAALLVLWLAALGLTRGLRRWFPAKLPYVWRQGLANLYRPANQTVMVVLALGFGAFLLGTLTVVQHNLLRDLRVDGGAGRPNLVFFDIQPDQQPGLDTLLRNTRLAPQPPVPIVAMRMLEVKGRPVGTILGDTARNEENASLGKWAFRREYRSTYRDTTVASEKIIAGKWWNTGGPQDRETGGTVPISIEVSVAAELGVTIGDTIVWDIQGIPLRSAIVNMREVNWARFEPNFYVVFPSGVLEQAPQSLVILVRVDDPAQLGRVQRTVVERFPNATSIDLSLIQQAIERIVASVVLAIRFMALFSLATGTVVLVGAVATSRFQRLREAALLKTLGATGRQVRRVIVAEYLSLGLLAALVAGILATAAGWALMKYLFESRFTPVWLGLGGLGLGVVALTVLVGVWSSADVLRKTPLEVLRAEE
ncbi:MAG: ABC transporter permease, partial [Gemmatimonadales bacterium]